MLRLIALAVTAAVFLIGATTMQDHRQTRQNTVRLLLRDIGSNVDSAARSLEHAIRSIVDTSNIAPARQAYERLRSAYKRLEPFAEYIDAEFVAQWVNGAPLPRIDAKSQFVDILNPSGLQVVDELLHQDNGTVVDSALRIADHVTALRNNLNELVREVRSIPLTDRMLIEITRVATIRIMAMGITGFDRPASDFACSENAVSLQVIADIIATFSDQCRERNAAAAADVAALTKRGIAMTTNATEDTFDRADFIRNVLDPLYGALLDVQLALEIELSSEVSSIPSPINPVSRSMFASSTLDPLAGTGLPRGLFNEATVELGKTLFFDPILSADVDRSCASCHQPDRAFTDGVPKSAARGGGTIDRNAPTLLHAVLARRFFMDLRATRIDDVIEHVIANSREFGANVPLVLARIKESPEYSTLFRRCFPTDADNAVNLANMGRAIAAYLATLTPMNSPIDRYLRGEKVELASNVRRGLNLFMGRAACATCHFPPTFAGYVPPMFLASESEILGVATQPDTANATIDPDIGRAGGILREQVSIYRHAFKTPTVRNVALTAPYMHNGAYTTLHDVVKFYDVGGGSGIGIDHPFQTLAADRLDFSDRDYDDLIAFMKALTDTSGTGSVPTRLPAVQNPILKHRLVGGTY